MTGHEFDANRPNFEVPQTELEGLYEAFALVAVKAGKITPLDSEHPATENGPKVYQFALPIPSDADTIKQIYFANDEGVIVWPDGCEIEHVTSRKTEPEDLQPESDVVVRIACRLIINGKISDIRHIQSFFIIRVGEDAYKSEVDGEFIDEQGKRICLGGDSGEDSSSGLRLVEDRIMVQRSLSSSDADKLRELIFSISS